MLKFDTTRGKVSVSPSSLLLTELKEIWENDKSETKERATDILTYIHLISQIDAEAPFAQASYSEVEELSARNTWPAQRHRALAVVRWLKRYYQIDDRAAAYRKAFETADRRSVRIFDKKIDQLEETIDKTDPIIIKNDDKGKISFSSNMPIITSTMKELSKLMDERDILNAKILRKMGDERQIMGSKKESLMEIRHRKSGGKQSSSKQGSKKEVNKKD
jgi:uncharacterized protein YyaL (SSP411 family)